VLSLDDDPQPGQALLQPVMRDGQRLAPPETLTAIRERVRQQLAALPPGLRANQTDPYPVTIAPGLQALAARLDREAH